MKARRTDGLAVSKTSKGRAMHLVPEFHAYTVGVANSQRSCT